MLICVECGTVVPERSGICRICGTLSQDFRQEEYGELNVGRVRIRKTIRKRIEKTILSHEIKEKRATRAFHIALVILLRHQAVAVANYFEIDPAIVQSTVKKVWTRFFDCCINKLNPFQADPHRVLQIHDRPHILSSVVVVCIATRLLKLPWDPGLAFFLSSQGCFPLRDTLHLIPDSVREWISPGDVFHITQLISSSILSTSVELWGRFLTGCALPPLNAIGLCHVYAYELRLPKEIAIAASELVENVGLPPIKSIYYPFSDPKLDGRDRGIRHPTQGCTIMAFLIIVIKINFRLDDKCEYQCLRMQGSVKQQLDLPFKILDRFSPYKSYTEDLHIPYIMKTIWDVEHETDDDFSREAVVFDDKNFCRYIEALPNMRQPRLSLKPNEKAVSAIAKNTEDSRIDCEEDDDSDDSDWESSSDLEQKQQPKGLETVNNDEQDSVTTSDASNQSAKRSKVMCQASQTREDHVKAKSNYISSKMSSMEAAAQKERENIIDTKPVADEFSWKLWSTWADFISRPKYPIILQHSTVSNVRRLGVRKS
eukprot:gene3211-8233_t